MPNDDDQLRRRAKRRSQHQAIASPDNTGRSPWRKDYDRLFYTTYFHRLAGITQVVAPGAELALIHNRLTHSLKVAQLARTLADRLLERTDKTTLNALGGLDPDATAAAALAHDIGHAPYGHVGEAALSAWSNEHGLERFEGNPQSFRIVTKLGIKGATPIDDPQGLDLTAATRRAILKYPWTLAIAKDAGHTAIRKWGAFATETEDYTEATSTAQLPNEPNGLPTRSLEAQIMDLCDDVSYALHDLEDFIRAGLIILSDFMHPSPRIVQEIQTDVVKDKALQRLQPDAGTRTRVATDAWESICKILSSRLYEPLREQYSGSQDQEGALNLLVGGQLDTYLNVVSIRPFDGMNLNIPTEHLAQILVLRGLTWHLVIKSPQIRAAQRGHQKTIRLLSDYLYEWLTDDGAHQLPGGLTRLRDLAQAEHLTGKLTKEQVATRAVVDYIATLTEPQVEELRAVLEGRSARPVVGRWVR